MKGININGTIKTYSSVPKTWGAMLGVNYMSNEDLKTLGFYDVVRPSTKQSEQLGDIFFDADNEVFTYPVESRTYTQTVAELKEQKILNLKHLYNSELAKTDWIIIRDQELGNTTDQTILDDRAQLRTDCATHETTINAKTTKASVIDYQLPSFI
jgi:hypothetical protein